MKKHSLFLFVMLLIGCSDASGPAGPSASKIADANQNEIAEIQRNLLADTAAVLQQVTDADSAKDAVPALEKIAERVAPLRTRRDELMAAASTPEDKMAFGQSYMAMLGEVSVLGDEFDRLEAVPGVREVLEGPMTKIMAFFER